MINLKSWLQSVSNPVFWFGLGIGGAVGVVMAAKFDLSPADAARFVGAMVGALVAVAGAISLHFLKERQATERRRDNLIQLLENLGKFNELVTKAADADDGLKLSASLRVTNRFLMRCKRFCEAHEFEDHNISMVGGYLENINDEYYLRLIDDDDEYDEVKFIIEAAEARTENYRDAVQFAKTGKMI